MLEWVTNHGLLVCWGFLFLTTLICQIVIPKHEPLTLWIMAVVLLLMLAWRIY
jgi:hypothetical protein